MLGFIKHVYIVLVLMLLGFSVPLTTKCVSMNNQSCMTRPTLIYLNPDELLFYPFIISLDRCDGSCNTSENLFGRICASRKIGDVNFEAFSIKKEIHESKT